MPFVKLQIIFILFSPDCLRRKNKAYISILKCTLFPVDKKKILPTTNQSANNAVDRYRSPVSGSTATIVLPAFSGRFASTDAA